MQRAGAVDLVGVHIPEAYQIDGRTLVLNGYGLRTLTFLRIKIYVAALYLPGKTDDSKAILASAGPKVVVVHYLHGGSKAQVQRRFREGEQENCGDGSCDSSFQGDFERLLAAVPAVAPGDTTTSSSPKRVCGSPSIGDRWNSSAAAPWETWCWPAPSAPIQPLRSCVPACSA